MLMPSEADAALSGKTLVFLVGAPRSGTTWLQLLLSRSPSVVTAQETDLFNIFLRPMVGEWNRYRKSGVRSSLSEVLSDDEFRFLLRSISGFIFAKIAEAKPSATIVLEKTPNHVVCWREILDLWPDARFIHIIRDPRSVVASRRDAVRSWGPNWGPSNISTITEMWFSFVSNGRQIGSATQNYQEVFFEELVSNSPEVVKRILGRLGVPSSLDQCRQYTEECRIENLKAGNLNNAPFDLAKTGKYRFRIGKTESWRAELSKWEIAVVERLASPLMSELGFAHSTMGKALGTVVRLSCAGKDVARAAKRRWVRLTERRRQVANLHGRLP